MVKEIVASAVVAAIVSAISNFITRHYDRQSERRRLLVEKSIDLALAKVQFTMKAAERAEKSVNIYDPIVIAERYYVWLEHLEMYGKLPDDPKIERMPMY